MSASPLLLHVWPGRWGLPSIDASCFEAILYLQLTFPGNFSIIETTDPDLSPSGQLPFLTHGQHTVSSLPSIVSYAGGLDLSTVTLINSAGSSGNVPSFRSKLDAGLSGLYVSQAAAWKAYIEAQLGDLVTHSFFVLEPNYRTFTNGLLASMLPVPQRYYVPSRIKEGHRPRLEGTGLWQIANEPEESKDFHPKKGHPEEKERTIRRAFEQVKLTERARLVFDILSRLLGEKPFIFNDRATTVDISLASRVLLLIRAPFPNAALKELLESSYPTLVAHASRTYALAFPSHPSSSQPQPPIIFSGRTNPLGVFKSTLIHVVRAGMSGKDESQEAQHFHRYSWGWVGLAVVGLGGFLVTKNFRPLEHAEAGQKDKEVRV